MSDLDRLADDYNAMRRERDEARAAFRDLVIAVTRADDKERGEAIDCAHRKLDEWGMGVSSWR